MKHGKPAVMTMSLGGERDDALDEAAERAANHGYVVVSASGNDQYNPSIPESGFGGRTQGDYELLVKFEPQVSQTDVIRDLDSDRKREEHGHDDR